MAVRSQGLAVLAALAGVLLQASAARAQDQGDPFRNPNLPVAQRVDDLLSRLTLDEKVSLMHQYQPAIPRLGMPAFRTGTEALHGVAWLGKATVFPQAIGLGSTWDARLMSAVGAAVGREARGFNQQNPAFNGLNLWAPVVNLLRDPRWGRNEEGYSEDPTLTAAISTAYGKGIEGPDPDHLQAAPTLKHYLAYNVEAHRATVSASVPPRVLNEYDRKAFRPAIAADAATGVMAAYNLVNGRPNHVSRDLDAIRSWTPRTLMNVADAFGVGNVWNDDGYYPTAVEADAAAIKAGLDSFTENDANSEPTTTAIKAGLAQGLLSEADVDDAVSHILSIRVRLGDFDPPGTNPYASIGPEAIDTPRHRQLARQAAREQMVLLKNRRAALPLNAATTRKVAVIGQLEDTLYEDWYSGTMPYRVTPRQGIAERLGSGAAVSATEGVDRIALRDVATGKYVTASPDAAGGALVADAATAGAAQGLDIFDWGEGTLALRAASNGRYVTLGDNRTLVNSQTQPNGWFVQQQFKLDEQPDGTYVLEYAGNDTTQSWFGPNRFVVVGADGKLTVGAATPDAAARFSRDVLVSGIESAVAAAKGADAAVVVVGNMPFINGREDDDRNDLDLSAGQEAVVKAVHAANPNTILVLESSYPMTITWEQANLPAILWTSHAGQETGHAVADVLFGDYSPAGRLPQTWYRSQEQLPDKLDFDVIDAGWTYQYFRGAPLYPFGYGLSYATFRYGNLRVSRRADRVTATVDVTNTGRRAADEVVQLYTRQRQSRVKQPTKTLRAFTRIHLEPGQTRAVALSFAASDLAIWDVTRDRWALESGTYDVMAGGASNDLPVRRTLDVRGETIPPRDLSRATQAQDWDAQSATTLTDETKLDGTAVVATRDGAWVGYAGSDLRDGPATIVLRVAKATPGDGSIAVRLDDPVRGRVVATVPVPSTGDRYAWTTVTAPLARTGGVHDVYLALGADVKVSRFRLGSGGTL
jgi:beta-glucosidase